jgi:tRNA uridine 5-carboxymethylaminomethyl modification enzyme
LQKTCHLTWTNEKTHDIIRQNLLRSALYAGHISGTGTRYCPSIETKIHRFADKDRHQVFLEPEGQDGHCIYPSGLSTSFPRDVQEAMIHSIVGLENARIVKWGYAVEYDAFQPRCLTSHLEVEGIDGLFLAGQILGTSGYEEAGALGLMAGANAALISRGDVPVVLRRDEGYIGVMIDDLTGNGVDEPYRMFTSRSEYRLLLREDNADERMLEAGRRTGLIPDSRAQRVEQHLEAMQASLRRLSETMVSPSRETNNRLRELGLLEIRKPLSLLELVRREDNDLTRLFSIAPWLADLDMRTRTRLEVTIKYQGYLGRQEAQARRLLEIDTIRFPSGMTFDGIPGLRTEILDKLKRCRPATLGQASRIPGMTPAALEILRVYTDREMANRQN